MSVAVVWGEAGLRSIADQVDEVVVVDVLSFSTAAAVAREQGAEVVPWNPDDPLPTDVLVAGHRSHVELSLSPASLRQLRPGMRLVLPSPNGSRLMTIAGQLGLSARTGCIRDRQEAVIGLEGRVAVVAGGERWPDGTVRFALEDWLGAGAIVEGLPGPRSPEAVAAVAAWSALSGDLLNALRSTPSGIELIERGFEQDVEIAAGG